MKLTRSVSYAVGILVRVERSKASGPLTAAAIAKGAKFPPRFLYRVLRRLVDAGLLSGVSGPGGGYTLARKANQISLLEIIRAVEADQETIDLKPVAANQRKLINHIVELARKNDRQFAVQLAKVKLNKLARM
ncbi:MAG: Rrf2 family transcriptional regulator [Pirellulales bacterium]|nr:Rrf2 family transcriptional regulator [Pirellulales bacterium]